MGDNQDIYEKHHRARERTIIPDNEWLGRNSGGGLKIVTISKIEPGRFVFDFLPGSKRSHSNGFDALSTELYSLSV